MNNYPNVSSPFQLGSIQLKNRIVMPPMGTQFATEDGFVTDRQVRHYEQRAKGGAGLVITEHTGICNDGKAADKMLMLSGDEHVDGMKGLVEAIHQKGAKAAIQLNHAGYKIVVPELSLDEIKALSKKWADAAARAKKTGADGVELHMANGYLMHSFLSPITNTRTDSYGGSPLARTKFPVEVLRAVKEAVGDFPVWCRISVNEYREGGIEIDSAKITAAALERAGAAAIHISSGSQVSLFGMHPTYYREDCPNIGRSREIKSVVGIPVITVGKIRDLLTAEKVLREGCGDLVSMGRALLAEPHLVNKSMEGRLDEIAPCLYCSRCVKAYREGGVRCTVNPEVGSRYDARQTERAKNVLVIGGGVAGLQCAKTCAKAGHKVTLLEKGDSLGGQVNRGKLPPKKGNLQELLDYLERRCRDAGVLIQLGREARAEDIMEFSPDAIVAATGAVAKIPQFPGMEAAENLLTFEDVLQEVPIKKIGDRVLILGGGFVGAETADYLASQGKSVTIVEMRQEIAFDASAHLKHDLTEQLTEKKVQMLIGTKVVGFEGNDVLVERGHIKSWLQGYDTIVLAMGLTPRADGFLEKLSGKAKMVIKIGDCLQPGEIVDAMEEGHKAAAKIAQMS